MGGTQCSNLLCFTLKHMTTGRRWRSDKPFPLNSIFLSLSGSSGQKTAARLPSWKWVVICAFCWTPNPLLHPSSLFKIISPTSFNWRGKNAKDPKKKATSVSYVSPHRPVIHLLVRRTLQIAGAVSVSRKGGCWGTRPSPTPTPSPPPFSPYNDHLQFPGLVKITSPRCFRFRRLLWGEVGKIDPLMTSSIEHFQTPHDFFDFYCVRIHWAFLHTFF